MAFEEASATPATRSAARSAGQNECVVSGELDASRGRTVLHLASGRSVTLPTELLLAGLPEEPAHAAQAENRTGTDGQRGQVIPLVAEQLQIDTRTVTTGTVRLHRGTETYTDSVSLPVTRTGWEVERTPVGKLYTEKPEVWSEGDVTVYPLVEERIVAKREYFVVEEVRVRRVATTTERTATVELKRDVLTVEREGGMVEAGEPAAASVPEPAR